MAKVKMKKAARKTASKKSPAPKSSAKAGDKSPAKANVNKSQAIRDHMAKRPQDGPNAVAAALKKMGIDVTPAFVSTVKSMDRKREESGSVVGAPAESSPVDDIPARELLRVKKMAAELGGVERARAALDALSKIVN